MMKTIELSHPEKLKMYLKCTKKKLAEMLIESNRIMAERGVTISHGLYSPYRCPICGGNGMVAGAFYTSVHGCSGTSANITEHCKSCTGTGIVWG